MTAILRGALGLALVSVIVATAQAAEVRVYPPPPPATSPIAGAIDFHVHSAPDVFGRSVSDTVAAILALRQGMRAIVLKNHVTGTADRAAAVMEAVPGIEVFGGIVLNNAVGGLNPEAVEWMHRMSGGRGKVVWLPSFDADNNLRTFGEPGEGIKVAVDGQVVPAMDEILRIIAREDLVLHTCHVSAEETLAVIRRARELGVTRIAVTHAMADAPGLSLDHMRAAADLGAYLELVYLNHLMGPNAPHAWMRNWNQVSIADMAAAIRAVGAGHFILSSDLGQAGNPTHADGYKLLVAGLAAEGIGQADIDLMMKANPARLLGLDP